MTSRSLRAIAVSMLVLFATACGGGPIAVIAAASGGGGGGGGAFPSVTGSMTGNVMNAPNPVSGATVRATGPGGSFTTTSSNTGAFRIDGVPVGAYTVDISGKNVFDGNGKPIANKISASFPMVPVGTGDNLVSGKPVFLPQEAIGMQIDTAGSLTGVIAPGTVIENAKLGVSITFQNTTTATFKNSDNTTISITAVPAEQIPMPLPAGVSASEFVSIQPPGATFDVAPRIVFANGNNIPAGTKGVPLYGFGHDVGDWVQFATGTVSADGKTVISDPPALPSPPGFPGLLQTGWQCATVQTVCTTTVEGNVQDSVGTGIAGVLVSTVNGLTGLTDTNGDYSIPGVPMPKSTFPVKVVALPPNNAGFRADMGTTATLGVCNGTTTVPDIVLAPLTPLITPPTVQSTVPANGDANVLTNSAITITFDAAMSPGSLTASNLDLVCDGNPVAGGISIDASGKVVTFHPTTLLPTDATCTIRVGTGVQDAAGNPLATEFNAMFTTPTGSTGGATSISLAPAGTVPDLSPGDTQLLTPTVLDKVGAPVVGPLVSYTSNNPNVASVDATGLVTATGFGVANITATFGIATATKIVTVAQSAPPLDEVVVTPATLSMAVGSVQQFTALAKALGMPLTGYSFDWSSDAPAVLSVDANGNVSALTTGTANITGTETLTTNFGTATIQVTSDIASVVVAPAQSVLEVGASEQHVATAFDSTGKQISGVQFTWSTLNASLVTVDAGTGLVTGVGPTSGPVTITATATDKPSIFGTSSVEVFPVNWLVVRLKGGAQENDPLAGVNVVRHNSLTGLWEDQITTGSDGMAVFGSIGAPRTSITVFVDHLGSPDFEASLLTFLDIAVGTHTITVGDNLAPSTFDVQVDGIPAGPSDLAQVFVGGYSVGAEFQQSGTTPSISVPDVAVSQLDAAGNTSLVIASTDSTLGVPTAAGFLLDDDPLVLVGTPPNVTLNSSNLTSVQWMGGATKVSATGGTVQRNGIQFDEFFGVPSPATTGTAFLAIPPGADALAFDFQADVDTLADPDAGGTFGVHHLFASAPTTTINLVPSLPDLGTRDLIRNPNLNTVSWSSLGNDAAALDVLRGKLNYQDSSSNSIDWCFYLSPAANSFAVPSLPAGMAGLIPPLTGVAYQLEGTGHDNLFGFDAYISALELFMGNRSKLNLGSGATTTIFVERKKVELFINLTRTGPGSVTITTAAGSDLVDSGDALDFDPGTQITVDAISSPGNKVTALSSSPPFPTPPTGIGTSTATATFDILGNTTVFIVFGP